MIEHISATELARRLGTDDAPFVLDVRTRAEVAEWPFPAAVNIPIEELSARAAEVPRDRAVAVLCASGTRSLAAAEALDRAGWNVGNVDGGMAAWASVYDAAVVTVGAVRVVQIRRRAKGCLSYVIVGGGEAFVVDPSLDTAIYAEVAAAEGVGITRIFDTHVHADHLSGARVLAAQTGARVHLNRADGFTFEDFEPMADCARFTLGDSAATVTVLHTAGHTLGSVVLLVDDRVLLSGDTLFVEGVGRPDLADRAEEFAVNLYRSLHDRVLTLDDDVLVLPSHYGDEVAVRPDVPVAATLGRLRTDLAPLSFDEDSFVGWAVGRSKPRPPNAATIVQTNLAGSTSNLLALRRLECGPNRCSAS